jgi:uncharacterized SAM-binding protein YcdF (DUF218 family)
MVTLYFTLKNKKSHTITALQILCVLSLYLTSISPVVNMICYLVEKDYLTDEVRNGNRLSVVVVLGGGINKNDYINKILPSYQTTARILHAVQVYNSSGAKYLICSGKGFGKITEAEVMKSAAEGLGVPVSNIKIDVKSENTKQHAEELNKLFKDKNITIGLVTSAYHMKRSEREFKKYFSDIVPLPSDYLYSSQPLSVYAFLPNSANLLRFSIAAREIIGIIWYSVRG